MHPPAPPPPGHPPPPGGWPQQPQHPQQPGPHGHPGHQQPGPHGHPPQQQPGQHGHPPPPQQPGPHGHPPQQQPGPYGHPPQQQHPQPGQPYGQPPPGQAPYGGQPQPGPYGQPPPGPYPGQPPHPPQGHAPYGQPPPNPYGQPPPMGPPGFAHVPGQHPGFSYRPRKSNAGAVLMAIAGGIILFITFFAWLGSAHGGFGVAAVCGLFGALAVFLIAFGAMAKAEAKKRAMFGGIAAGLVALVFTAAGPSVSSSFEQSNEERKFEKLEERRTDAYFDLVSWHSEYLQVDEKFRREGWESTWMAVRAEQAISKRNLGELRVILGEIDGQTTADYSEAKETASGFLKEAYAEAIKKLSAPAKTEEGKALVDHELRKGFAQVLDAFVASPEANLYLAFEQKADLTPPEGDADTLTQLRELPELKKMFPKGAPVIEKGDAFSSKYDVRRRNMFSGAMTEAFHKIFDDELLHLVPLAKDQDRKDKHVLEVRSSIRRIPVYGTYYQFSPTGQKITKGLTFEFVVGWSFQLIGPDGKVIYKAKEVESQAAPEVSLGDGQQVPQWAIYGALMDSAYYNYSREVIARFGLNPPPERTVFPFNAVSSR